MGNIKFKLNLNKHPKDCEDYSMIHAQNVRVSDDFSCLQSEESIIKHTKLTSIQDTHKIVGYIPCNTELILFAVTNADYEEYIYTPRHDEVNAVIFRYSEQHPDDTLEPVYTNLKYNWGKIKGTFTYNINSELIIAFSEYDGGKTVPLKTINLGTWEDRFTYSEKDFEDDKLATSPAVQIPMIMNHEYISGSAYKGWYHFFIRYKINDNDYTKWFSFGYPIFVCTLKKQSLTKYGFAYEKNSSTEYNLNGIVDYFSDEKDIANETVRLTIDDIDYNYSKCQLGFICNSLDYSKAYRTEDLNTSNIYYFILNISSCVEYDVSDFIVDNNNYYNVKNIINYNNRLYISNYKEKDNLNLSTLSLDDIIISISKQTITFKDTSSEVVQIVDGEDSQKYIGDLEEDFTSDSIPIRPVFYSSAGYTPDGFRLGDQNFIPTNLPVYPNNGIDYLRFSGYILGNEGVRYEVNVELQTDTDVSGDYPVYARRFTFKIVLGSRVYKTIYTASYTATVNPQVNLDYNSDRFNEEIQVSSNNTFINVNKSFNQRKINTTLIPNSIYAFYIHFVDKFGEISRGYLIENTDSNISGCEIYTDYFGRKLFITPKATVIENGAGGDTNSIVDRLLFNFRFTSQFYNNYPAGYVGHFFSYEKFEPRIKFTGLLTKYDAFEEISLLNTDAKKNYINYSKADINLISQLHFYCPELDINDAINLKVNKLRIYKGFDLVFNHNHVPTKSNDSILLNAKYPANYNSYTYGTRHYNGDSTVVKEFSLEQSDISIAFAGDGKTDKLNKGTSLIIKASSELKDVFEDWTKTILIAELIYDSPDYYSNTNKELIRLGNIFPKIIFSSTIDKGLPGCITYQAHLHYNYNGFKIGAYNEILTQNSGSYYDFGEILEEVTPIIKADILSADEKYRTPIQYIHQLIYDTKFNEAKSIKNNPEYSLLRIEKISSNEDQVVAFSNNILIAPNNSIDLFRNKYPNCYELVPKTYIANEDKTYITKFDKRVQRSNVISDESLNNSWRNFPVEGYKDISENKGNITNLLGIGLTLLVHTEHSLFMFDRNNTLQNGENEEIRLAIPDAFDIDYREVFTSDLGVCGLQDEKAWIAGQFGYIFYDNDAHRFYKFANGKVELIDYSIVQFLNTYIPYHVRFAHDKERNRIIVCFYEINEKEFTLSYNYTIKEWISFHTYRFSEACNTKNFLYLFEGLGEYMFEHMERNNIYSFKLDLQKYLREYTETSDFLYLKYDNNFLDKDAWTAAIYTIIHGDYNAMKTFEYLMYKLFKRGGIKHSDSDYSHWPGDEKESAATPYSGYRLKIYNDLVSTGFIDVSINSEDNKNAIPLADNYKKPWWELGNWNFNYLRDIKQGVGHDIMARLYGNYFVIAIELNNENEQITSQNKLELEDVEATIITDETV